MADINRRLEAIAPDLTGNAPQFEKLKSAADEALPIVAAFARVSLRASAHDDQAVAIELIRRLEPVAERYVFRGSGVFHETQFAFWRFIGRQLLVTCVGALVHEGRWGIVGAVLSHELVLENTRRGTRSVPVTYLGQPMSLPFLRVLHKVGRQSRPIC